MTEQTAAPTSASTTGPAGQSPGALLREARERRGMHIAALAAAIKVAPARLEALEADDYSGMPDTTFVRALAQAVCRALKVDPAPVLARMPESAQSRLERVDEGINAPFRDRPGRLVEGGDFAPWRYPAFWVAVALLAAAAAFIWWPKSPAGPEPLPPGAEPLASAPMGLQVPAAPALTDTAAAPASTVAAGVAPASTAMATGVAAVTAAGDAASRPAAASLPIFAAASTLPAAPATAATASAPAMPVVGADAAVLRAVQDTWVQVTDASGKVLAARTFTAGEAVPFTGPLPLRVRIGNVQGTELAFRGKPVDLRALTKDNTITVTLPLPAATP